MNRNVNILFYVNFLILLYNWIFQSTTGLQFYIYTSAIVWYPQISGV